MWWYRLATLAIAVSLLCGCGFRPLYGGGNRGPVATELGSVRVKAIPDRLGQQVHNHLLDLMNPQGRPTAPRYVLTVQLRDNIEKLAVRKSETATRANFTLDASYRLLDTATNETVFTDSSFVVSSYNILSADFATLASERDAQERAAEQIAENIATRLALFLRRNRTAEGTPVR